jgi:hypothetical protein
MHALVSRGLTLLLFVVGCASSGSSTGSSPDSSASDAKPAASTCSWPSAAETLNDAGVGCHATASAQGCQASQSGQVCKDVCLETEYVLSCHGDPDAGAAPVPAPDEALHCNVLRIPMPLHTIGYCCPCSG